jgi:predicted Zn-dependent protease
MLARLDGKDGKSKHGFSFHLKVVDAPIVNAYALPGGHMVVYTGLLKAADSPAQVAGVLAHEMSHVTRRHGMQRIAQSLGVIAAIQLVFGDVSGVAAVAVELLREGAINSYSREHEHEADMDGVKTLARAGADPKALAEFFAILQKREGDLPAALSWLGTHPNLSQRIADVKAAAAKEKVVQGAPLVADWQEVLRSLGKAGDGGD